MAAAGVGVAFVDDLSARAHRHEGIAFVPLPRAPQFPIYSVVNVNRPLSRVGRDFLTIAAERLRQLGREPLMAAPTAAEAAGRPPGSRTP